MLTGQLDSDRNAPALLALHTGPGFVLPNAWDASSARILEHVGRIVAAVGVPVTADLESGYGNSTDEVGRTVARARELLRRHIGGRLRRDGRAGPAIPGPLNVVARLANTIDVPTLFSLGVKRVSLGGSLTRAALSMVERARRELLESGTLYFLDGAMPYADLQRPFRFLTGRAARGHDGAEALSGRNQRLLCRGIPRGRFATGGGSPCGLRLTHERC